jgi:ABC-2 type transport system ATP-binding protein
VVFTTATPTHDLAPLLAWANERGIELDGLAVRRATLEDVYLQLTAYEDGRE